MPRPVLDKVSADYNPAAVGESCEAPSPSDARKSPKIINTFAPKRSQSLPVISCELLIALYNREYKLPI